MKYRLCCPVWLILLFLNFIPCISNFDNHVIYVPKDFTTIQAAINAAPVGSTIIVMPGTYNECIKIDKPLTLIGNNARINGMGGYPTVEIHANGVSFIGFRITTSKPSFLPGVLITYSSKCFLSNVTVTNHYYGIRIYDSSKVTLRNCIFSNNKFNFNVWGLTFSHFMHDIDTTNLVNGKPIYYIVNSSELSIVGKEVGYVSIINSFGIILRNLSVCHNEEGALIAYSANCTINQCLFENNVYGVRVLASTDITLESSNFSRNHYAGILVDGSTCMYVYNNAMIHNLAGIILARPVIIKRSSDNNTIVNNRLINNTYGLQLNTVKYNRIEGNIIESNDIGLYTECSNFNYILRNIFNGNRIAFQTMHSNDNLIFFNSFLDNEQQVKSYFSLNCWSADYPLGGNYWKGFNSEDFKKGVYQNLSGSDGIADAPYIIDNSNIDLYPQVFPCRSILFEVQEIRFLIDFYSYSKVLFFSYNYTRREISLLVNCSVQDGFRIILPKHLLRCSNVGEWKLIVDGQREPFLIFPSKSVTVLFSNLTAGVHLVEIVGCLMFKSEVMGDINLDLKTDGYDVFLVLEAYGSYVGHYRWNPFADLDMDGMVSIVDVLAVLRSVTVAKD